MLKDISDLVPIKLTSETALTRTRSKPSSASTEQAFANAIRDRDRGCIIAKVQNHPVNIQAGVWDRFEAAHIFPLAYSGLWNTLGFDQHITIPGPDGDNINSVQNGILLGAHIHALFDTYAFSISAKHGYKVISFRPNIDNIAGTFLPGASSFLTNPNRPPDALLDWHSRQAVLTNMKGMGEPCFESDFPPGSNMFLIITDYKDHTDHTYYQPDNASSRQR
ncbi:hypothetical protein T310_4952 [Rasamsonia emersonii CBS 393.64]|uniref:HNH nuclease domain-containing protein n=1 Tax=Rasamsonia emersonii (strain ATCC 16479 / CBS 393.64 / IMI 116815) TaxID=1408163 RepID=A0A0F4YT34_RASE3|nr:hypothetical protein T310_4952 [Rasamsonia emersonii CBS 393.64]KKA21006.1 hypothetical protein T310_4952 [Rasamsonia emersonii CBS 393.64]